MSIQQETIFEFIINRLKQTLNIVTNNNTFPANKTIVTTGVGNRAVLIDSGGLGSWEAKFADFNILVNEHYIVEVDATNIISILPPTPHDKMHVMFKVVNQSLGGSLFINRNPLSNYKINDLNEDLEVDISSQFSMVFIAATNSWYF